MAEKFDFYNSTTIKSYNLDESIRYQLKMLDGLDAFTRRHSENVANITCRLCENLGLSKGFTIYTTTCAYLHDLGKIFIPPSVLQKPGRLTDEEYTIMKTHTTIGYKMCMDDLKLRPYSAGPLYHHEGLDGSGYPNGVKGNDIPYEGQIIRVADEFDAITSKRQYKTHVGIIDTLNILIDDATPQELKRRMQNQEKGLKKSKDGNVDSLSNPAALAALADSAKPKGLFGFNKKLYGKIDKRILKALFKVVIDDTEYEIVARSQYIEFLEKEIKRIEKALASYNKMEAAHTKEQKDYYKEEIKYYLKAHEDPEKIPVILQEFKDAYTVRKEHIAQLYKEVREIKRLNV